MADRNTEIFCSEIFRFDVGPSRKIFYMHEAAVSRISEPFKAMMTDGWKESCENFAFLEHVNEKTFAQFVEFVYSGNYNACEPEEDDHHPDEIDNTGDTAPPVEDDVDDLPIATRRVTKRVKHDYSPAPLQDRQVKLLAPIVFEVPKAIPFPVESASIHNLDDPFWNYSATLLSHAQLFDFAELYLVDGLRELTTHNLYTAINTLTLHTQRVQDVVQLVKYVYDSSPKPRESQQSIPSLRRIISHFAANNIHFLVTSEEFRDLLVEGGLFAKDLVVAIVERM